MLSQMGSGGKRQPGAQGGHAGRTSEMVSQVRVGCIQCRYQRAPISQMEQHYDPMYVCVSFMLWILGQCVGLAFALPCGRHKLQLQGPESLCFAVVSVTGLHVDLLATHGAFPSGRINVERLMQTRSAVEMTAMGNRQAGSIIHTDDTLEGSNLDAVIFLRLLEILRHIISLGEVDRRKV